MSTRLRLALALLLGAAAAVAAVSGTSASPARSAALPLGTVSLNPGADPQGAGGATQAFSVACPGVQRAARGFMRTVRPAGKANGVILFFSGGGGTGYWGRGARSGEFFQELAREGKISVEIRWQDAWLTAAPGEAIGPARLACRPATIIRWAHDNLFRPLGVTGGALGSCGFCITGNSGGATQVSYALSHYGLDTILDAVVPSGGPPHAAMAKGCLRNPAEQNYWYAESSAGTIDRSYGFVGRGDGPCARHDPSFVPRWLADSVDTSGDDYVHPRTRIVFLFGAQDRIQNGFPLDYIARLRAAGSPLVSVVVAPNTPHATMSTPEGLAAFRAALLAGATPATVRLSIVSMTVTPKRPRAGKSLTARLAVSRTDTRGRVTTGRVACSARVGGKAIRRVAAGFRGGAAQCSWVLPASARGKMVSGSIRVTQGRLSASRTFRIRVA